MSRFYIKDADLKIFTVLWNQMEGRTTPDLHQRMAEIEMQKSNNEVSETNQSLRAEINSEDKYVRRMRPTFGYFMAVTWAAQMMALAYVIVFQTDKAGFVLQAMSSLSAIWAMGLSVLGIYVYKRSEEKKAQPGEPVFWSKSR